MFRTNLPGRSILHITLAFAIAAPAFCQTSSSTQPPSPDSGDMRSDVPTTTLPETPQPQQSDVTLKSLPLHLLQDQRSIYTSPAHIRTHDLLWLLPTGAAVGAAFATDLHTMSTVVSKDASFNKNNIDASNVLTGVVLGVPAVLYGLGAAKTMNTPERQACSPAKPLAMASSSKKSSSSPPGANDPTRELAVARFSSATLQQTLPSPPATARWSGPPPRYWLAKTRPPSLNSASTPSPPASASHAYSASSIFPLTFW